MFRGPIVLATLAGVAESQQQQQQQQPQQWAEPRVGDPPDSFGEPCTSCAFNVSALEEFSVDYTVVAYTDPTGWTWADTHTEYGEPFAATRTGFTTSPLPDTFPSEHGTIAVHARNLQLKLDSHAVFPTPFALGPVPVSGMEIHEELHINGAAGQASFHLESPIVNLCFQLDNLPPVTQQQHDMINGLLQQAEQMGPALINQHGVSGITVDGEQTVGFARMSGDSSHPTSVGQAVLFTEDTHPKIFTFFAPLDGPDRAALQHVFIPPPSDATLDRMAMKFDNYAGSVGNQFSVRACDIESQTATQSLLAANPEAREFLANRISQHQKRLQALLEPVALNTRFNFIPLEIADLMIPAAAHCTKDELAEIPGKALTTLQVAAFSVCSFVMGVTATFAVFRKKTVTLADDYHQVSA